MPWYSKPLTSSSGNPSCEKNLWVIASVQLRYRKGQVSYQITDNSPPGIPSSQWERILKEDTVNLNHIFTLLHHIIPDKERTGRLGDMKISFGISEPKKHISTASEWSATWWKASRAIAFTFPHHREQLLEYRDYIETEFATKSISSHHKILLYDAILRNEVASGQHILLTDHYRFSCFTQPLSCLTVLSPYQTNTLAESWANPLSQATEKKFVTNSMLVHCNIVHFASYVLDGSPSVPVVPVYSIMFLSFSILRLPSPSSPSTPSSPSITVITINSTMTRRSVMILAPISYGLVALIID